MTLHEQFRQRADGIPHHGLGLSVDLYSPDLFEVVEALEARGRHRPGFRCDYLEIFKATEAGLARVRHRVAGPLNYHAEGLWVTQPDLDHAYALDEELRTAAAHVGTLRSWWLTHECASKQMGGYSFGTYLPPLFTTAAADVVAGNVTTIQAALDALVVGREVPPLVLLEIPPLTYFGFGDLPAPAFFRRVTDGAACGLVLDVGHVWTYYRYSGTWRRARLEEFLDHFLEEFPLERVVQIHVAGLARHRSSAADDSGQPWWIDAHGAAIPECLLEMLQRILRHSQLTALKGIALEVDTKPIDVILQEFEQFRQRCAWWDGAQRDAAETAAVPPVSCTEAIDSGGRAISGGELLPAYRRYAEVASGVRPAGELARSLLRPEPGALDAYRDYLRDEILEWGGTVRDMFPDTCRQLVARGVPLEDFVSFWFREPRRGRAPYDFFLLKIERFLEFIAEVAPEELPTAERHAAELRAGYHDANELVGPTRHEGLEGG